MIRQHTPLHLIHEEGKVRTGGRLTNVDNQWYLNNAHGRLPLTGEVLLKADTSEGQLVKIEGYFNGSALNTEVILYMAKHHQPTEMALPTHQGRAQLNHQIRRYFEQLGFMEAHTPCFIPEPGTDVYLDPFKSYFVPLSTDSSNDARTIKNVNMGYFQTSPEFAMKRMLSEGHERIYQLTRAWRNGEVTDLHQPEFTILEWYRAWESMDAIMEDVEHLVRLVLEDQLFYDGRHVDLSQSFEKMTMQEVVYKATGLDLLACLNLNALKHACETLALDVNLDVNDWDALFSELQVAYIDPFLATQDAIFVTHWPRPLAVLARADPADPRVALRFELYIAGLELANGFDELVDPQEQHQRFQEDVRRRRQGRLLDVPMPRRFLNTLKAGLPPSAGVAMGVDRLLMLALGARNIQAVLPFGLCRDPDSGTIDWG